MQTPGHFQGLAVDATVVRPPYSGVQISVMEETKALASLAPGCSIYTRDWNPKNLEVKSAVPRFPGVAGRIFWQQILLPRELGKQGADVLFSMAYTCPLKAKVPVVLNVHDIIALEHPELCSVLNTLHMKALLPASIRKAAKLLVSTRYVADRITGLFPGSAARTEVIPLGVDYKFFAEPRGREPGVIPDVTTPYILFVGNLEPKKGIHTLLDAYSLVAAETNAVLVLAGRAAWKSAGLMKRIRGWQGPGKVLALGRVPREELPGLYQNAAAFVFPSLEEGFGMPVLEAMAAGAPVIHSEHPALMEASGGCGLPFPGGSSEALASALREVLGNRNQCRDAMVTAGKRYAEKQTWTRWAEQALNIAGNII